MIKLIEESDDGCIVLEIDDGYFIKLDNHDTIMLRDFLIEKRKRDLAKLGYD